MAGPPAPCDAAVNHVVWSRSSDSTLVCVYSSVNLHWETSNNAKSYSTDADIERGGSAVECQTCNRERARVRILFAAVSKIGQCSSNVYF